MIARGQLCEDGSRGPRAAPDRSAAVVALAAAFALCLLTGCLPLRYPKAGEPVAPRPGEALVFGRIRMVSEGSRYEFRPFSRNPWDHVLKPDPDLSLELRRFEPPGGAFIYKAYPSPVVEDDGSFYWLLPAGDYALFGRPRLLASQRGDPREAQEIARFTIPKGGGTVYVGTALIVLPQSVFEVTNMIRKGWTEYEIRVVHIVDERDEALSNLRARFSSFPPPLVTALMRPEWSSGTREGHP
jgi:hypothetical protein